MSIERTTTRWDLFNDQLNQEIARMKDGVIRQALEDAGFGELVKTMSSMFPRVKIVLQSNWEHVYADGPNGAVLVVSLGCPVITTSDDGSISIKIEVKPEQK